MKTAYIVGTGLSYYAGLPLQSEFTARILAGRHNSPGPSRRMVEHLETFVRDVFEVRPEASNAWPDLEDVFTFVDLSANTGHHLGRNYRPKDLRQLRRELLARTIRMLHQCYEHKKKEKASDRKQLKDFLISIDRKESSFISLNWDTSLERTLLAIDSNSEYSYGSGVPRAQFEGDVKIRVDPRKIDHAMKIAKMHGSANWLYCDNCRRVFCFPPAETLKVATQIAREPRSGHTHPSAVYKCCYCGKVELSTRIATFSYRKALDFPMFQSSWALAEKKLRNSGRWIFIGYSLPAADFEFKYLLKRVEIACSKRPEILVVSGGKDETAIERTLKNYQGLFGGALDQQTFFTEGLSDKVIARIT